MKAYVMLTRAMSIATAVALLFPSFSSAYQAAPVALTKNATFVTEKSAVIMGQVNANETADTYAWFEWGISGRATTYDTPHRQVAAGTQLMDYSETIYGLAPNVQYYYRLVAESSRGRDVGITTYFTTKPIVEPIDPAVIVSTKPASSVTEKSATLKGYIAPHQGQSVRWWFEWGLSNKLENGTAVSTWGADSGVAQSGVTNLTPGTVYYYRIAAENTQGVVYGNILSLTTKGTAPEPSEPLRAQSVPTPEKNTTAKSSSGNLSVSGGSPNQGSTQGNSIFTGGSYQFTAPYYFFGSLFGAKSGANAGETSGGSGPSGSSAGNGGTSGSGSNSSGTGATKSSDVAAVGASTPIGGFWGALTGKRAIEVKIEKIGPKKVPAHTAIEYRVTYAYRRSVVANNAKLKIILPGSVVYIGDNTTNELLLEEGSGPERTYVLPVGRLENGSTRTISLLGMTTADANGEFPEARARLEFTGASGVEVVSADGAAVASGAASGSGATAGSQSSFSLLPSTFFGWILYVALIALLIFTVRKARAYYLAKKAELAMEEEAAKKDREARGIERGAILA